MFFKKNIHFKTAAIIFLMIALSFININRLISDQNYITLDKFTDSNWDSGIFRKDNTLLLFKNNGWSYSEVKLLIDNNERNFIITTANDYHQVKLTDGPGVDKTNRENIRLAVKESFIEVNKNNFIYIPLIFSLFFFLHRNKSTAIKDTESKSDWSTTDLLRVIGTLLVIFGHSLYANIGLEDYSSLYSGVLSTGTFTLLSDVIKFIYTFHMPLFFFLSGVVYYYSRKPTPSLDNLVKSKFNRLIIPAFKYGILFMIPIKYLTDFYGNASVYNIITSFVIKQENVGHLWFLISLFWVFALFYIIHDLICRDNIILTLAAVLIVTLNQSYFYFEIYAQSVITGYHGLLYFTLGYAFIKLINSKDLNLLLTSVLVISLSILDEGESKNMLMTLATILTFYYFCAALNKHKLSNSKIYKSILKNSFMLYILHDPLNYLILSIAKKTFIIEQLSITEFVILVLTRTIGVIMASLMIIKFINLCHSKIIMPMQINLKS